MKVSLGRINGFLIFGFLPITAFLLPAVSFYLLLLGLFLINRQYGNVVGFFIAIFISFLVVEFSALKESLSFQQYLNSLNFCFAFALIPMLIFARRDHYVSANSLTSAFMLAALFLSGLLLLIDPERFDGIVQILAFNFAAYFCVADKIRRKLLAVGFPVMAGARSIMAGLFVAYVTDRFRLARSLISLPVLLLVVAALISGLAALQLNEFFLGLQADQISLKGRTGIWLALIQIPPGWFGNGVGYALLQTEATLNYFQLPHSDWLRIYVDFGMCGVIATLTGLFLVSRKSQYGLFMSIVLGVYMLVGNPLSFPTVIVTYFFISQKRRPYKSEGFGVWSKRTQISGQ